MGTRGPCALADTTPAKTILVYRNGDRFSVGRKFVLAQRGAATFEALLEQLTERVEVPFGVRRLYTPTHGRQVCELPALQAGGKYVAAGREPFKKLESVKYEIGIQTLVNKAQKIFWLDFDFCWYHYIHIVPRKPVKMRKLKEWSGEDLWGPQHDRKQKHRAASLGSARGRAMKQIKPVVHCDINVPSRWQTPHRISRPINVFTNGRLFTPPVKIIIPQFTLTEWGRVLAMIGEKVFPLGGVRKKYTDTEKCSWRKKKEGSQGKGPHRCDSVPPKAQDSVFYAKEGKKNTVAESFIQSGAEGDVYQAQTPNVETQEAPEVKEDEHVQVEVPEGQMPAEIVKDEEIQVDTPDLEGSKHLSRTSARMKWFRFLKKNRMTF
ncbi:Doublecortin Domain-Containing Protein 2C [Manis pentadactyla]|nr:Doublecortin Domain-Containing Protein 2C [Manis pentadactyla]